MTILARLAWFLLKGLLALFPAGYRREYRDEHARVLRLALEDAAGCGRLALLRFILREVSGIPQALLQAYQKEWRLKVNIIRQSSAKPGDSLVGSQVVWFLLPFIFLLVYSLGPTRLRSVLVLALLLLVLGVVISGFIQRLPLWALPSLGFVISLSGIALINSLSDPVPVLTQLKAALWTGFMPSRMLYAMIVDFILLLPGMLLLVGLALLAIRSKALPTFRAQLNGDRFLLAFMLYVGNLINPFLYDDYRGLGPYRGLFILILAGGVWLYLRALRPSARLGALVLATLLSGLLLSFGIYYLYPHQEWVMAGNPGGFPRWWGIDQSAAPYCGHPVFARPDDRSRLDIGTGGATGDCRSVAR